MTIQYRLSLPATVPLDEVVHCLGDVHKAASLLPVIQLSPFQVLGAKDIKEASDHGVDELRCALLGLSHLIRVTFDRHGKPSIMTDGHRGQMVEVWPRRAVGFSLQPGFESDRLDLLLVEYPPFIQVTGRGPAAHQQFDLPTGVTGWTCDSLCSTGGRDSSLVDFLKSHLLVTTLLDYAKYSDIEVNACDPSDYWGSRSLGKLMATFPGTDPPNWVVHAEFLEALSTLSVVTNAVDPERLCGDLHG